MSVRVNSLLPSSAPRLTQEMLHGKRDFSLSPSPLQPVLCLWRLRPILPFPQALTWTDVPHHVPVFHPSSGAGSSRHELGLVGFLSPPAPSPGSLLNATRNPPCSSQVAVDLPTGNGGTFTISKRKAHLSIYALGSSCNSSFTQRLIVSTN